MSYVRGTAEQRYIVPSGLQPYLQPCRLHFRLIVLACEPVFAAAQLDVRVNSLGVEDEAAIKDAVSGKTDFIQAQDMSGLHVR